MSIQGRALHFVFRVSDRSKTAFFYREILGMKILRHEEFSEGCEAACNGAYATRWSKTMVGYGPEDSHFVVELTYNYGVNKYEMGNDFLGLTIKSSEVIQRVKTNSWPFENVDGNITIASPGGYKFHIIDEPQPKDKDPVQKVTLASSDLDESIRYWNDLLCMKIKEKNKQDIVLCYSDDQCVLQLKTIGAPVNHAKAYGRIAFAVPKEQLPVIQAKVESAKMKVLTPLISLDTPGKATVTVVILADPDGHEICFVDEEGFRQLSQVDPQADADLNKYIKSDKSISS